jgi:hypothetical protein
MSRLPTAGSRISPRPGWTLAFAFLATMLVLWLQGLLQGIATTETEVVSHDSHRGTPLGLIEPFLAPAPAPISEATQHKLDGTIAELLARKL